MKIEAAFWGGLGFLTLSLLDRISGVTGEQLRFSATAEAGEEMMESDADTASFIFASFAGLLQQWPNTFAYSGHSIVPGVIPQSTLLYHGTNSSAPPVGTEWLAFDPEMSYWIHSMNPGRLHLYTYVTTRPLRVIYLDGQSASWFTSGFMDSQSVLINGTVGDFDSSIVGDYTRARDLCQMGKTYGFEGVVRMNTGFELIWCDFQEGIEIVQVTNATDPFDERNPDEKMPDGSPCWVAHSPFFSRAKWLFGQTATRQYFAPGEVRVKLDASGFISFYDRIESLSRKRRADGTAHGPRSRHRLYGISEEDAATIHARFVHVLARKNAQGWRVDPDQLDLQGIVITIIQQYSTPLKQLRYTLRQAPGSAVNQSIEVRALSYQMLMPYVDFSTDISAPARAAAIEKKCRTAFTSEIYRVVSPALFTPSVQVIVHAIEGTLGRLCATVYDIFAQAMALGLPATPPVRTDARLETAARARISRWRAETEQLMDWLGWSVWDECDPSCKPDELCIIPMWPFAKPTTFPTCANFSTWSSLMDLRY